MAGSPSPYGRDPFTQLNRLLESHQTAPGSIKKVCLAVEECLANNRDNLRGFFDKPFSNLLKRVFGYGDFEASWLNIVTKGRDADARALVNLLAPDGKLFAAMAQADSDRLVQYIFPTERLPAHTQELLKEPQGLGRRVLDTWPQYRGRIRHDAAGRPQVYLNLFEYFMFWTAFYVLRGSSSDNNRSDPRSVPGSSPSSVMYSMGGIRSVGSAIVGNLIMGRSAGTLQAHPYYRLLKTYLEYFLPRSVGPSGVGAADGAGGGRAGAAAAGVAASGRPGGVRGMGTMPYGLGLADHGGAGTAGWATYKPTLTAAAAGPDSRGAVLLSILVEFWLTDPMEPLPSLAADRVSGVVQPGGVAVPGLNSFGMAGGAAGSAGGYGGMGGSPGGVPLNNGTSPTPVAVSMPPSVRMITYQPPSAELVEGLVALVRYVHVVEQDALGLDGPNGGTATAGNRTPAGAVGSAASGRSPVGSAARGVGGVAAGMPPLKPAEVGCPPWLPDTPVKTPPPPPPRLLVPPTVLLVQGNSASAAVQAVSRKVYRQLRRAFSEWAPGSPSSLTPLITLWLSVLAPWCPPYAHTRKSTAAEVSGGHGSAMSSGLSGPNPAGAASGGAGAGPAGSGAPAHVLNHHHHHHGLDGASALGSAAAAAAGVMEATAAKLQLGGALVRDRDRDLASATSRELLSQYTYTPAWRSHVLAHLPFYLVLLPHFVSLSASRLKYRPDVALRDLDRVLAVLAAAGPGLLRELRAAEAVYNDFARPVAAGGRRRSEGEYGDMVPWWLEQTQDFEAAAAAGTPPQGSLQADVMGRLFTTDSSGAAYVTCALLHNAEMLGRPELVAALRQSAGAVLPVDSILPAAVADQPRPGEGPEGSSGTADSRRFPRAGRWSSLMSSLAQENPKLADPHALWAHMYRGRDNRHDPMLRPIASNEVSPLVRPLVRTSMRINRALGLDVPYQPGEEESDPPEHLVQQALLWARKRGYRVNLRYLAEIQTLLWLLGLALLAYVIMRTFSGGGSGGGDDGRGSGLPHGSTRPGSRSTVHTVGWSGGGGYPSGRSGHHSSQYYGDPYGHQQYSGGSHASYYSGGAERYPYGDAGSSSGSGAGPGQQSSYVVGGADTASGSASGYDMWRDVAQSSYEASYHEQVMVSEELLEATVFDRGLEDEPRDGGYQFVE